MSQNYEKLLNAEDYMEFFTIFDIIKPADIPGLVEAIKEYLQNSYKMANKVRSAIKPISISEHVELLDSLHDMFTSMINNDDRSLSLVSKKEGINVSIIPFTDILVTCGGLRSLIDDLAVLLNTMRNYLNSQNVDQYKSYSDFVEMLMVVFDNMANNHKPTEILMHRAS